MSLFPAMLLASRVRDVLQVEARLVREGSIVGILYCES